VRGNEPGPDFHYLGNALTGRRHPQGLAIALKVEAAEITKELTPKSLIDLFRLLKLRIGDSNPQLRVNFMPSVWACAGHLPVEQ
jgi:hypothetical protein